MSLHVEIRKSLGDFTLETAFEADAGVTGILGASGCGKSMTLRCIAGIVRPDEGRIELDGTVFFDSAGKINLKPQQRHVGLLFQNYALFPNMTVRQNLMTGLRSGMRDKKEAVRLAEEMTERFCLGGLEDHRPCQLSGGQQQRVALARILLSKPRMLMLDEPFSALDEYLRWNLELELSEVLQEFGGTTLFVSHSRDEIYRICDRVCVMDRGKSGKPVPVKQLFEAPVSRAAALLSGCKNYSRACRAENGKVFAADWGVMLEYAEENPEKTSEEIRYIGVRSHSVRPIPKEEAGKQRNVIRCKLLRVVEEVFSVVILVQPLSAPEESVEAGHHEGRIRVEVTREFWADFLCRSHPEQELWITVEPEHVMLLS